LRKLSLDHVGSIIENANDSVMRTVERLGARSRLTAAPLPLE
jgi:hypothetical protein